MKTAQCLSMARQVLRTIDKALLFGVLSRTFFVGPPSRPRSAKNTVNVFFASASASLPPPKGKKTRKFGQTRICTRLFKSFLPLAFFRLRAGFFFRSPFPFPLIRGGKRGNTNQKKHKKVDTVPERW